MQFVHRDIEPKHVGVHGPDGRLGIMDCGSAVPIQVPAAESVGVDPATSGAAHAMQAGMAPARSKYSGVLGDTINSPIPLSPNPGHLGKWGPGGVERWCSNRETYAF